MADCEAATDQASRPWPDWSLALLLVAVSALLHGWMVANTQATARDSIGFVRYAHRLEQHSWSDVVLGMEQHPGFPTFFLMVSYPIRHFLGTTPDAMMLSAQVANALAAVLLVVPMYYLGREFFGPREAFGAALCFQLLPVSLQVTSDGLSEGLYLLFAVSSLCWAAQALRTQSQARLALAGLAGGLAYLTRPEGLLVVLSVGLVLIGMQAWPAHRWPWRKLAGALTCLGLTALIGGSPYFGVTGAITRKPTAVLMLQGTHPGSSIGMESGQEQQSHSGSVRGPLLGQVLAVWYSPQSGIRTRPSLLWSVAALISETARTLQYGLGVLLLIGLAGSRPWLRLQAIWLLLTAGLINAVVLVWLGMSMGYISERHTLLIAALCMMPVMLGLSRVCQWLENWLPRCAGKAWIALGLAIAGLLLPAALQPLHANRAGHRAAGHWLAEHARPCDVIVDPFCWAHYYAGHVLLEGRKPAPPPGTQRIRYVIVEQSSNPHVRLTTIPETRQLAERGTLVYRWEPAGRLKKRAEVIEVYAVPSAFRVQAPERDL